jgi:hypothetical protein
MKSLICLAVLLGSLSGFTQDCKNYYYLQNNKTVEMTIYNKKGNANGKQVYSVTDVKTVGGSTTGTIHSEMFNEKGKSIAKGVSNMKCTGGVLMIDMKMMLPQQQAEQFAKADATVNEAYIEYPVSMKAGDQLKDGNFNMEINNSGLKQSITMLISERKVEAKENITTPAGSWDCFKISSKTKMNIRTAGIGIPMNMESTEWYAPGFGVVKTQSKYGGTEITSIK